MSSLRAWLPVLPVLLATGVAIPQSARDWNEAVRKVAEHPRYAVRRAVAGQIAHAGDAAVGAIREYSKRNGPDKIPLVLADAIARDDGAGAETIALLAEWATDREFYWRSQALGGLASRARGEFIELFRSAVVDASHLFRIAGARGLLEAGDGAARVHALLRDPDPRVRLRIALMLLERGDPSGIPNIIAALGRSDLRFLDDPWGERDSVLAQRQLEKLSGLTLELHAEDPRARADADRRLLAWARSQLPEHDFTPPDPPAEFDAAGGVEVRSCRNGDLFLRWSNDGHIALGLAPIIVLGIDDAAWRELRARPVAEAGSAVHGKVICDYVRILERNPKAHHKAAPGALPADIVDWLEALGKTLEVSGYGEVARALDGRVKQFVAVKEPK